MKSLKFASLILLCATSVLSLVLPALGVVSFPEQFISTNVENRKSILGQTDSPIESPLSHLARHAEEALLDQNSMLPTQFASFGSGASQGNFPPNSSQNATAVLPPNNQQNWANPLQQPPNPGSSGPTTTTEAPANLPLGGPGAGENQQQVPPGKSIAAVDGFGWEPDLKTRKVGTGIWLLLGPVWILALLIWSLSPSPGSGRATVSKKRT